MKAFLVKWWGKFKTSPMYVKAGIVALIFIGLYMLFTKKSNEYDNVTSAEIQNGSNNSDDGTTYTTPNKTSTTNGTMTTDDSKALYEAQLQMMRQENDQLSKQLSSVGTGIKAPTTPSVSDYLKPIIATSAGNWLNNLINPSKQSTVYSAPSNTDTTKIITSNTTSPINYTSNSSNIFGSKDYTGFGSDIFGKENYGIGSTTVSSTNLFNSDTYTGFGSNTYAKDNFGW